MANSGTAGYFGGGNDGSSTATVDKFAFPDDSRTTLGTGLSAATYQLAGAANSGTAAYFAGGYDGDAGATTATVDKFAFASDSRSTLGTGLSAATEGLAGAANSGTAGYFGGGRAAGSSVTTVDKFAFPGDSRSTLGTGLSAATRILAAAANSGTL